MNFKEYFIEKILSESPRYVEGNWDEGIKRLSSIGEIGINSYWNLINTFEFKNEQLQLREFYNKSVPKFILGYWDIDLESLKTNRYPEEEKKRFIVVFEIHLTRKKSIGNYFNIYNLYQVNNVALIKDFQDAKIAQTIYRYLVNELNMTLLSDSTQYFGARKLWSRLSKELDFTVDVVNLETKEILEKNVRLIHGQFDKEYDKKYWSEDESKKNIRFILRKIEK